MKFNYLELEMFKSGFGSKIFEIDQLDNLNCVTLYLTHICTNNKKNRNAELIKSFKTHLNKNISKRVKGSLLIFEHHYRTCPIK